MNGPLRQFCFGDLYTFYHNFNITASIPASYFWGFTPMVRGGLGKMTGVLRALFLESMEVNPPLDFSAVRPFRRQKMTIKFSHWPVDGLNMTVSKREYFRGNVFLSCEMCSHAQVWWDYDSATFCTIGDCLRTQHNSTGSFSAIIFRDDFAKAPCRNGDEAIGSTYWSQSKLVESCFLFVCLLVGQNFPQRL